MPSRPAAPCLALLLGLMNACDGASLPHAGLLTCPPSTMEVTAPALDPDETSRWCRRSTGDAHGPYRREAASGRVLMRGAFADNLAEGPWEWLFETGAVASLVTFDDGRAHGRQARWSATLELELERYWEHGSPCGLWVDYTTGATRDYGPCDDGLPPPRERPAGFAPTTVAAPWPGTCDGERVDGRDEPDDGIEADTSLCIETLADGTRIKEGPYARFWDEDHTLLRESGAYLADRATGTWYGFTRAGAVVFAGGFTNGSSPCRRPAAERAGAGERYGECASGLAEGTWTHWYEGGAPRLIERYEAGLRDGPEEGFHPSGERAFERHFSGGERDGAERTYGVNGLPLSETTWVMGVETGLRRAFFEDGALESEVEVLAGRRHGEGRHFHRGGRLATTERWVDDVLHGPYEVFDASGEPLFRGAFDRGQLQGEALVRQRDPRLGLWVREVVNYVGGRLQGPVVGYYENQDTRWRELHYVDGVATGTLRQWWPNENPQLEVELAWGLWQGLMRSWHEQGGEAERCGFVLGLREGPCTRFWDNGQKKAEGTYRHNLKAPGWLYWDREGRPLTSPPDGEHEGV